MKFRLKEEESTRAIPERQNGTVEDNDPRRGDGEDELCGVCGEEHPESEDDCPNEWALGEEA